VAGQKVSTISAGQTGKRLAEGPPIDRVEAAAYTIPTDQPESDGTFTWNSTTMIVVTLGASEARGVGYSYTDAAAGALADAGCLPMSAHTKPGVHRHVCCAVSRVRNLQYFHDHVRIEQMLFDGATPPIDGMLVPDRSRPGLGLEFKRSDAERFAI
jgi:hypothetical protein